MTILTLIGLTAFWAVGVAMVAWSCYALGYARGQVFQMAADAKARAARLLNRKPVPVAPSALTQKQVMDLLAALEKIIDFAAEIAPKRILPKQQVHH